LNRASGLGGHKLLIVAVALAALTLGGVASYLTSRTVPPEIDGLLWPQSKALTAIALEDHHRQPFTLERLKGRWTLLFFGYTHCPDVCPVTMSVLKNALALMAGAGTDTEPPQVVFVSVDPARDTLDHLAAYVGHFNPDFLGVTGAEPDLKAFVRQLGVLYILSEPDRGPTRPPGGALPGAPRRGGHREKCSRDPGAGMELNGGTGYLHLRVALRGAYRARSARCPLSTTTH
jgi:protein SCO1/2